MSAKHPPYAVTLSYADDLQMLTVRIVDHAKVATLSPSKLEIPILLDDFDFKIDDEFARRLGAGLLNLIALGQPEIKQYMSVTPDPIQDPDN